MWDVWKMVKSFSEKLEEIQALAKLMESKIFINDENEELWDSQSMRILSSYSHMFIKYEDMIFILS